MSEPSWALGYSVDELRKKAEIFFKHKPHVYGAFGLTRERDIATAMKSGGFFCNQKAAAIGHVLSRDSVHRDFADRAITIQWGTLYLKAVAALTDKAAWNLLVACQKQQNDLAGRLVVESFEEDTTIKQVLEDLGFSYLGTKVMAGGEIKGLYGSPTSSDYVTPKCEALTLEKVSASFLRKGELKQILHELQYAGDYFEQHYSSYNKRKSWSAFALRGFDPRNPGFIIKPSEMSKAWKEENLGRYRQCQETNAATKFPTVWDVLRRIPCVGFERVRFMRLAEKKGELSRHADITDPDAGTANGKVARLHIPIQTSPLVKFRAWDERGMSLEETMEAGALWYLDTRKPHAVVNEGDTVRIHLVVDAICNEATRKWLLGNK